MKRHKNALAILEGARNVRAIAKSLLDAAEEAASEGIGAEHDAAVRMIVHRLARLCKTDEISYGFDAVTLDDTYCQLVKECRMRAEEKPGVPVRVVEPVPLLAAAELPSFSKGVQG